MGPDEHKGKAGAGPVEDRESGPSLEVSQTTGDVEREGAVRAARDAAASDVPSADGPASSGNAAQPDPPGTKGIDTGASPDAAPEPPAEAASSPEALDRAVAALLEDGSDEFELESLLGEDGVDLSEDFLEEGEHSVPEAEELDDEEFGWAIGSELEFIDDPGADTWDGPTGDGLDEEEGRGGFSLRPTIAPRVSVKDDPGSKPAD